MKPNEKKLVCKTRLAHQRERGFSLIELMISMVIGLVVVGAALAAYLGTGGSSRASQAVSQVTEDANLALNVLRTGINMVGYGEPFGINGQGKFNKRYTGTGLRGCDQSFTNPTAAIDQLACPTGDRGGADAMAVAYQVDARSSVTGTGGVPLDCLGNPVDLVSGAYITAMRFYVADGKLMCSSGRLADSLVENVDDLQILYGVGTQRLPNQASAYMKASNMVFDAANVDDFDNVVSVRICVLIHSAENVLDAPMTYQGCNGEVTAEDGDRRLYRAFTTTVVLQNRLGDMM